MSGIDVVNDYENSQLLLASGNVSGSSKVWRVDFDVREKLNKMSNKELKEIMQKHHVDYSDCFEKQDLILRASRFVTVGQTLFSGTNHSGGVFGIHLFHKSGQRQLVCSGANDGVVTVCDWVAKKTLQRIDSNGGAVSCVQLYDGGTKVVFGCNDSTVRVFGKIISKKFFFFVNWISL